MSEREDRDPESESASLLLRAPSRGSIDYRVRKSRAFEGLFGKPLESVKLGRFTLLERIGIGGMGDVYSAYDEQLDRKVAIKLVRKDAGLGRGGEARLFREARTLARLSHPNVVQIHEVGRVDEHVFIAMEFIRGVTLTQWLDTAAQPGGGCRRGTSCGTSLPLDRPANCRMQHPPQPEPFVSLVYLGRGTQPR